MKKYLPLIVIILLLALVAGWFVITKTSRTTDVGEKAFSIEGIKNLNRITLTSTDQKHIDLTKTNGVWMVNSKFAARDEMLGSLMEVMNRITILSPVAKAAQDNVVKEMLDRNIKVEVYETGNNKPVLVYYVGGPTVDGEGTYMILERDGKNLPRPFVTYVPGIHGYVTPRYELSEENWRSRVLFKYQPGTVQSFSLEYPGEEAKSFTINKVAADSFSLQPKNSKFAIHDQYRQQYIRQYLSFLESVSIEVFDNGEPAKDSIMQTVPYCIFTITDTNNVTNKAKLFYMPVNRRSKKQFDEKGEDMTYDIDHYFAAINDNKDFAVVQYYVFGKLLRSYKDFYFKPGK